MNDKRKPIFTALTPFPRAPSVTLFEDQWADHIVANHVDMLGKEAHVQAVVTNPTMVVPGTANNGYVIYVNQGVTSIKGTPLAVIVDPQQQMIVTSYYNRTLRVISPEQALWLQSEIK